MSDRKFWLIIMLACLIILIVCLCSCSVVEVRQEHYRKDFGRIPQEGTLSVDSMASLARASTEVNKGLGRVKGLFEHAAAIEPAEFVKKCLKLYPQIEAVYNFSFLMIDHFGSMLTEIDWDNPEAFIEDLKAERESYKKMQIEKRELEKKYAEEKKQFEQNLMQKEKIIKDKDAEMKSRDGKWSMRFSWWVKLLSWIIGLLLILGFAWYLYGVVIRWVSGIPFKLALLGGKAVRKTADQLVESFQQVRLGLQERIQKNGDPSKTALLKEIWEDIHADLERVHDSDVKKIIENIKDNKNMKSVS